MFISIAINRISLKIESKMSDQDAIATSIYAEKDTLGQQPTVRCQKNDLISWRKSEIPFQR